MIIRPMLAKLVEEKNCERENYIFEPKLDGFRALCYKKNRTLEFYNRKQIEITQRFPELNFADHLSCQECILDGEIVAYNKKGNPDFRLLMENRAGFAVYVAFDICRKDGVDLFQSPLKMRKEILEETIEEGKHLQCVFFTREGRKLLQLMRTRHLEGIIGKQIDSAYRPGTRSEAWIKIKTFKTQDCIIVGFREGIRKISSLSLAVWNETENKFRFMGNVGSGFNESLVDMLYQLLSPLRIEEKPPFFFPKDYADIKWVTPKVVCEVKYLEIDSKGMLRNPVFLRLREDKSLQECVLEDEQTF